VSICAGNAGSSGTAGTTFCAIFKASRAAVTRFISAASILAAATFPFGVWMILHPPAPVLLAAFVAGAFVVYRHRANWERLRAGTEPAFSWRTEAAHDSHLRGRR
jgi:glycerol-3-phosphate acyltransferase PlsY